MTLDEAYAYLLPGAWSRGAAIEKQDGHLVISKGDLGFAITRLSIKDDSFKERFKSQLDDLDKATESK